MAQQLRPSKLASKKPKIDWSRREEADNFAHTVKLYRQGKLIMIVLDDFVYSMVHMVQE